MAGKLPIGRTVVFDDDGFYIAGAIADRLIQNGNEVVYVTPHAMVSNWTANSGEQPRVHKHLAELGVNIMLNQGVNSFDGETAILGCVFTETVQALAVDNLVLVTCRSPRDALYHQLQGAIADGVDGAPKSVKRIGDAEAPAIIAAAIYAGHKYAREMDCEVDRDNPAKYDRVFFEDS